MKYKNYYKILGLSSAKASDEEIKSAYRTLAKKYHPDNYAGTDVAELAEEKMKQITNMSIPLLRILAQQPSSNPKRRLRLTMLKSWRMVF